MQKRDKVFVNKPIEACYGCQACAQICTHNAITMSKNEEGFIFPLIDSAKCIDCGLCEKVCPTQDENISKIFYDTPTTVYAAWNACLAERLSCTSGGIFFTLASQWINNGGVVYGVDYDNSLAAYHRRVNDIETLRRLCGSKYLQSDIGTTFRQVKEDLKKGLAVLYSGTPCQIAGLRLFLRKDYDKLLTIDLVCHGTPSPQVFKEHIKYLESRYGDKIIDFKFRAKKKTGWRSYVKYVFKRIKPVYFFWGGTSIAMRFTLESSTGVLVICVIFHVQGA